MSNGTYGLGDEIDVRISFYRPDGTALDLSHLPGTAINLGPLNHTYLEMSIPGRTAEFLNKTGGNVLFYRYTVMPGDISHDLGYLYDRALHAPSLRSGSITVLCTLPAPGDPGSLRYESDVVVDAAVPTVRSVYSPDGNGTYGTGRIVNVTASLEKPAVITAEPRLMLNTDPPRNATYAGGNGTDRLSFLYTVGSGDEAARLDYASASSLSLEGGSIANIDNGIAADALPLPEPGDPGSLSASSSIGILGGPIPILRANGSAVHGSGFDMLEDATDVAAFRMNGSAYALVAARGTTAPGDHGIQLIRIHPNGTLSAADWKTHGGGFSLYRPGDVAPFESDGAMRAIVSSQDDSSIQLVDIHPNGTLSANGSATSATLPALAGASGAHAVPWPAGGDGGPARILVSARTSPGSLQLVGILPNGTLLGNGSATHGTGGFKLANAAGVDALDDSSAAAAAAGAGSPPRALVASHDADSLQLVSILPNGTLLANGSATRGSGGFDVLDGPTGVTVFDMAGRTRAVAPSFTGNSLQLVDILPNGDLVDAGSAAAGAGRFGALRGASDAAVFGMGGWTYALVASYTADGIQLIRIDADGDLVDAGSALDGDAGGFDSLDGAEGVAVFDAGGRTHALVAAQNDDAVQLVRLSPASVAGVSSPQNSGSYPAGAMISIAAAFDERVVLQDPSNPPSLLLSLDGENRTAPYLSGNGTDALVFNYTVMPGDSAASGLEYAHSGALASRGAVTDVLGNAVDLGLPDPRTPGSLAHARAIVPDTVAPRAVSVSSPNASGAYGPGSVIQITVSFDEDVAVDTGDGADEPSIALRLDEAAGDRFGRYDAGGSAGRNLSFAYAVEAGDNAADLGYAGAGALSDGSGTIKDMAGNPAATLSLPDPTTDGLLGDRGAIRIDTRAPSVLSVSSPNASAAYARGDTVHIAVEFSEEVYVEGSPTLELETGQIDRNATYASGSGTRELTFLYAVQAGDVADRLDYTGTDALSAGAGGSIRDEARNSADLDLPDAGSSTSLSGSSIGINVAGGMGGTGDGGGNGAGNGGNGGTGDMDGNGGNGGTGDMDGNGGNGGTGDGSGGNGGGSGTGDGSGGTGDGSGGSGTGDGSGGNAAGNTAIVALVPGDGPVQSNLTDRGDEVRVTINVTGLAGAGAGAEPGGPVQFPSGGAVVATSFASVSFPPGATAWSVPADGLLALHVVAASDGDPPSSSSVRGLAYGGSSSVLLQRVVEIGHGNGTVVFDMPVRISLEGQAGGRAFYIGGAGGAAVPIDAACAADDVARVDRHLNGTGECRIDSEDGEDMVIYTYHLTRFGTVLSGSGASPPVYHTCSVGLGRPSLDVGEAALGGYSDPAEQTLLNTGSAPFARVGIEASPWRFGPGGDTLPGAGYPSLPAPASGGAEGRASSALVARVAASVPAGATEVGEDGRGGAYVAVGGDAAVARGLGGGDAAPLWFRLNLTPYDAMQGGAVSQSMTYNAECALP